MVFPDGDIEELGQLFDPDQALAQHRLHRFGFGVLGEFLQPGLRPFLVGRVITLVARSIVSSPVSARTMNSWLPLPPMAPGSASTAR